MRFWDGWPASVLIGAALFLPGCPSSKTTESGKTSEFCSAPEPTEEAVRKVGLSDDGVYLLPGGRALTPVGKEIVLGGFPVDVLTHPTQPIGYVSNTGYSKRSLQVVDLRTGEILQDRSRKDAFFGMALNPDGTRLYASGGPTGDLQVYDIEKDGTLAEFKNVPVGKYPAGIALSADGKRLWVGLFLGNGVVEIDSDTFEVTRTITLNFGAYALAEVPGRHELYVTGFGDEKVAVINLETGEVAAEIVTGGNPQDLIVMPDEKTVIVSVADRHEIISIDPATRTIARRVPVGETGIAVEGNIPLPGSSPAGMAFDGENNRLYVVRAADNAVGVFDAVSLTQLGAIPVGWYPTAVALAENRTHLLVLNGKGIGTGPLLGYKKGDESGKQKMTGTGSIIDLDGLDLPSLTAQVEKNVRRPDAVLPFDCKGTFPVPASRGGKTPIEHIVLIVRENKTYDSELGDLGVGDADPSLVLFGEEITPNLHALARRFALHDNFYNDSETSVQGHLWLTSSFVNDYMERTWIEDYRGKSGFATDAAADRGQPDFGTFFTHLLEHDVEFVNFGEAVGALGKSSTGKTVVASTDLNFPGVFFNTDVKDEEKARYVARRLVEEGPFPPFVFLLLPNDHTHGTSTGALTPESMINDNDYATGIVVDAISHSPYWEKTAIFIVEDDPQQGADHVDYHRSYCIIASPWVKRGHLSRVHTSFPSLFRTFELILDLPPMNRYDHLATPFWESFTGKPDLEPFDAIPRTVPDARNPAKARGAAQSLRMDFRGPDRNPDLGDVLWYHRKGTPPAGSRLDLELRGKVPPRPTDEGDEDEPEEEIERDEFDRAWRVLNGMLAADPKLKADLRPRPTLEFTGRNAARRKR